MSLGEMYSKRQYTYITKSAVSNLKTPGPTYPHVYAHIYVGICVYMYIYIFQYVCHKTLLPIAKYLVDDFNSF